MGRKKEDEFKMLEREMIEKGTAVEPIEKTTPPSADDIEKALERKNYEEEHDSPHFISPEEEQAQKKKKNRIILIVVLVTVLAAGAVGGFFVYRMMGPSREQADLNKVFGVGSNEVALIVDGELSEEKGVVVDGETYIPHSVASSSMDDRLYIDEKSKTLSYATPDGVTDYGADEEKDGKKPLVEIDSKFYIALSFIAEHEGCEYTEYSDPARIAIYHDRAKTYSVAQIGSDERIRTGPGIKYAYMVDVKEGDEVFVDNTRQQENEFQPVITKDGVSGYLPMAAIAKTDSKNWEFKSEPVSFEQLSVGDTLCLGWHNIGSANYTTMPANLGVADSLNVIAPTWFILSSNKGSLKSIATKTYVDSAHAAGKKVWPTVRDFPTKGLKLKTVLGKTNTRRKLIKNIIKQLTSLGVDGINVDFERVKKESAKAYLQFLRELTLECHKKSLVVSSDNYPIQDYNLYYNPDEQGRVVDYVIFMAYDEHYAGSSEAGSVSSIVYVQDAITKALQRVPKERIAIGLPFFTRLWTEKKSGDEVKIESEVLNMNDAEGWVWSKGAKMSWQKEIGQSYAEYKVNKKTVQKIWLENEKSIKKKVKAVKKKDLAGVAFWSLGSERAITWDAVDSALK